MPNLALYNLRDAAGASQQDVADALNGLAAGKGRPVCVTANQVSRWERGIMRPSPFYRQLLAEHFGVSVEDLDLVRPRAHTTAPVDFLDDMTAPITAAEPAVRRAQRDWRAVRHNLNAHRCRLARTVAALYDDADHLPGTGLLTGPGWLPPQPVPLRDIALRMDNRAPAPRVRGTDACTEQVRPPSGSNHRYHRYSQAIRALDHPRLFENRLAWRLLDLSWSAGTGRMSFTDTTYFEQIDLSEALAHEAALHLLDDTADTAARWEHLHTRAAIGPHPFDLTQRTVAVSTDTLTIRSDRDGATFVLHDRNSANVAVAGGMLHIMPAGVFQPSSILPDAKAADFDLWRNIMREYSEEFLGNPEHDGDGAPIDYTAPPFGTFDDALRQGRARVFCLGVGLDALTLYGEVLTVAVFDADIYDQLFGDMVDANEEGAVVRTGRVHRTTAIPFTEHTVMELLGGGRLAPAAAGCLRLAWDHRRQIIDR